MQRLFDESAHYADRAHVVPGELQTPLGVPTARVFAPVNGGVGTMGVILPGGRKIRAPWSNISPCSTISERLADMLQLEQLPLKNSRKDMCMTSFGPFGGSKVLWHYVRNMDISLEVQRGESREEMKLTVGPLLVHPTALCPLAFGQDLMRALNSSITVRQTEFVFGELAVSAPSVPMQFTGPDPDNPGPPCHGTCSWWWNPEVEHETCAQCGFEFPNLMKCAGCRQLTYCSKSCQKRHWKSHRDQCIPKKQE